MTYLGINIRKVIVMAAFAIAAGIAAIAALHAAGIGTPDNFPPCGYVMEGNEAIEAYCGDIDELSARVEALRDRAAREWTDGGSK